MKILSMAWTTEAFLQGTKTVTRRDWDEKYAMRFHEGDIVSVYDRNPRHKGKKIGEARITRDPYRQKLRDMPDDHFEREGGTLYWKDKKEFIAHMGGYDMEYYVIEFEKLEWEPEVL